MLGYRSGLSSEDSVDFGHTMIVTIIHTSIITLWLCSVSYSIAQSQHQQVLILSVCRFLKSHIIIFGYIRLNNAYFLAKLTRDVWSLWAQRNFELGPCDEHRHPLNLRWKVFKKNICVPIVSLDSVFFNSANTCS